MIDNKVFEDKVHEILKNRGMKITTTTVPPTWRPHDMVIEVNKLIENEKFFKPYK